MSLDTTTFTPEPRAQPFEGLGDLARSTNLPRGELSFQVENGVIPAPGTGDNQRAVFDCLLPANFAYVIVDAYMMINSPIAAGEGNDWDQTAFLFITDGGGADRSFLIPIAMVNQGVATSQQSEGRRIYTVDGGHLPKVVIAPVAGATAIARIAVENATADDIAADMTAYIRFLVYDIDQWHHVEVNTAALVR